MSEEPLPDPVPSGASCDGQHCVTCSDEAVRVTVLRLLADGMADVETELGTERISVALVPAAVGDTVLVHAGEAIATVEE
ncbi:hydrogenase expression/formation protein HypC [Actinopolyspora mzabensis]|uniref:Hydrogenase expression/formation protein HypC n=1 Tax=Actinopolyspora mzabensis TaxID=995066 RepID=A0A1G8ZPF0_ACTMZ|nr:HypC/HybG/HupF family hydrogenase formation chaperone [Actinopolyspora mzabensis]SDK16931.1 hydrogenase expression/formation protein HypC [Actinopolyspora mzabensis]